MAWRRPGDKLLSEPIMVSLLTFMCVTRLTRPQWVICYLRGEIRINFWNTLVTMYFNRCYRYIVLHDTTNKFHSVELLKQLIDIASDTKQRIYRGKWQWHSPAEYGWIYETDQLRTDDKTTIKQNTINIRPCVIRCNVFGVIPVLLKSLKRNVIQQYNLYKIKITRRVCFRDTL